MAQIVVRLDSHLYVSFVDIFWVTIVSGVKECTRTMKPGFSRCPFIIQLPLIAETDDYVKFIIRYEHRRDNNERIVYAGAILTDRDGASRSDTDSASFLYKYNHKMTLILYHGKKRIITKEAILQLFFITGSGEYVDIKYRIQASDKVKLLNVSVTPVSSNNIKIFTDAISKYNNSINRSGKDVSTRISPKVNDATSIIVSDSLDLPMQSSESPQGEEIIHPNPKVNKQEKELHCIVDGSVLIKIDVKEATSKRTGETMPFPRYECPKCKRRYTTVQRCGDLQSTSFEGEIYTNIQPNKDDERYVQALRIPRLAIPGTKCFVYMGRKPYLCRVCGNERILTANFIDKTKNSKKEKQPTYEVMMCKECKTYYIRYDTLLKHSTEWELLNEEEIPEMLERHQRKKAEKERQRKERNAQVLKKREEQIKKQQEIIKQRLERAEQERLAREEKKKQGREQLVILKKRSAVLSGHAQEVEQVYEHDNNIRVRDFVVRRTTFKCRYKAHSLQNIDAVISYIDKHCKVEQTIIPAGYCPNCNIFFIMESTYQNLKSRGTPVCRVSDEKAYLSGGTSVNVMGLAQESVLMQYGYTVSQEEGLTSARRRRILAILIDYKILTRSDILSYLDSFINLRKGQSRLEKAIEKWESDREFVSNYGVGTYSQYGVSGIYRKY